MAFIVIYFSLAYEAHESPHRSASHRSRGAANDCDEGQTSATHPSAGTDDAMIVLDAQFQTHQVDQPRVVDVWASHMQTTPPHRPQLRVTAAHEGPGSMC